MNLKREVDHYDAFTFVLVGLVTMISCARFIYLTFRNKRAKEFPGPILIIIVFAEFLISLVWFLSGVVTVYTFNFERSSNFENEPICVAIQHVSYAGDSISYLSSLSFFISMIIDNSSNLDQIKFKKPFYFAPFILSLILYFFVRSSFGINAYGICGFKTFNLYVYFSMLFFLCLITIRTTQIMKITRKSADHRTEGITFYISYAYLVLVMYGIDGLGYLIEPIFKDCVDVPLSTLIVCSRIYYTSKIISSLRIYFPLGMLMMRMKDPFIDNIMQNNIDIKDPELTDQQQVQNSSELAINAQKKKKREIMILTIMKEIKNYFERIENINPNSDAHSSSATVFKYETTCITKDGDLKSKNGKTRNAIMYPIKPMLFREITKVLFENQADWWKSFEIEANEIEKYLPDGGKSSSFILESKDRRFIIKTITNDERTLFCNILPDYCKHILSNQNETFIVQVIGAFIFQFPFSSSSVSLIVMKSVFGFLTPKINRKYDLKGSTENREVRLNELKNEKEQLLKINTLKDINFRNNQERILLSDEDRKKVLAILENDSNFLKSKSLIDYSLLLGIIDQPDQKALDYQEVKRLKTEDSMVILGIIDFLETFTFTKKCEKVFKNTKKFCKKTDVSCQPPDKYAKRFVDASIEWFPAN